jgi:aminocarboxymuconate-semialdehyde decarboxylase
MNKKDLGMRGVEPCANVSGRELAERGFDPVFARLAALGMVVPLRPGGITEGARLGEHDLGNLIGNPLESTIAAQRVAIARGNAAHRLGIGQGALTRRKP